jgi:hypothetical protein
MEAKELILVAPNPKGLAQVVRALHYVVVP